MNLGANLRVILGAITNVGRNTRIRLCQLLVDVSCMDTMLDTSCVDTLWDTCMDTL